MYNLEKQLHNLPKGRLSIKADLAIRLRLFFARLALGLARPLTTGGRPTLGLRPMILKPVMVSLIVILIIAGSGVSAYAYTSDQVTMASNLYFLKLGLENLEGRLATTPMKQVEFHAKLAARRLAEASVLSQEAETSSSSEEDAANLRHEKEFNLTLHEADEEIEDANQSVNRIDDKPTMEAALNQLSVSHLENVEQIKSLAKKIGLSADDETTDNIALVFEDVKDHQRKVIERLSRQGSARLPETDSATSTATTTPAAATTTAEQAAKILTDLKDEVRDMKETLSSQPDLPPRQVEKLSNKLQKKLDQAERAMKDGNLNKFDGLIKATEALTNNGKHFIKESTETKQGEQNKEKNQNQERGEKQENERADDNARSDESSGNRGSDREDDRGDDKSDSSTERTDERD